MSIQRPHTATPNQRTQIHRVRGAATVFSDYASVLGARVGSAVLSLVSVLMTTRILDPTGYGTVAYFGVIATLIFTVTSAWTSAAVARYGREELELKGSMLAVTWSRFTLSAPLLAVAGLVVVGLKLVGVFPATFAWSFTWLSIAFGMIWVISEHVIYVLEAAGRMKLSAAGMILQQATVVAALAIIFATGQGQSPIVIATVSVVAAALMTVIFGSRVASLAMWPPRHDSQLLHRMVRFSIPMIAFTVSQYVIRSVDLIVISAFASSAAVGLYAVAYQAYTVLQALTTASGPVLIPLFVSLRTAGKEALVTRYLERVVPQLTFLAAVVAGFAVPFVGVAVPIVFGDPFADSATPLTVLLFGLLLVFAANLLAPIIVLHERTRSVGVVNLTAAAVNIAGDVVLLGPLGTGIVGASVATTIAMAIILIGYVWIARDCTQSDATLPLIVLLPFLGGFVPAILIGGAAGVASAAAAVSLSAAVVLFSTSLFESADVELISQLDMPSTLKRLTFRIVAIAAR